MTQNWNDQFRQTRLGWRSQLQQGQGQVLFIIVLMNSLHHCPLRCLWKCRFQKHTYRLAESKLLIYIFFSILPDSSFAHRIHNFLFQSGQTGQKDSRRDVSDHFDVIPLRSFNSRGTPLIGAWKSWWIGPLLWRLRSLLHNLWPRRHRQGTKVWR